MDDKRRTKADLIKELEALRALTDITKRKCVEETFAVERRNLQKIFDVVNVGMLLIDEHGAIKRINNMAARMFGKGIDAVIDTQPGDFLGCVHTISDPAGCGQTPHCSTCPIRSAFESVLHSGKPIHGAEIEAFLIVGGTQTRVWLDVSIDPIEMDGKKNAVIAISDITSHKQIEDALREAKDTLEVRVKKRTSELERANLMLREEMTARIKAESAVRIEQQRLYDVLNTLPAYVILLSPDYHVPFANRFFEERFGKSHGKCCFEYLFNRTEPCEDCETYRVFKTRAPHHWEWVGPDGRNYDIYDYPFVEADDSIFILEMGIDITERKRAEEALHAASGYTRRLIEASLDPLVTISPEGKITDVNEATEEVTGCSRAELIGTDFSDYFTEPDKAKAGYQHVLAQGEVRDYPLTIRHVSGRTTEVLYHATVYLNEAGEMQGVFAAARDITDRKQAEAEQREMEQRLQQTQRLESLGVLAGGIAHDFNNILMAILAHAEMAFEEMSPISPGRGRIAEIKNASMRAADLCGQLLAYSGKGRIEKCDISLQDLIEGMLHMLKTCTSKKCVLNLNLEKELPGMYGDPSQIRQILMNLVINASESMEDHSGVITVSTGMMDCSRDLIDGSYIIEPVSSGAYIYLEVSDTGCGMNQATMKRIFEPFFTTKFTGRGLGLSAILGIVRAHGGALKVCSEVGKGTTFKVLFPVAESTKDGVQKFEDSVGWRGEGTVLLVEDEESVRVVSDNLLRHLGLEVLTAEDGQQAIELYRNRQADIDLVLLDLIMPNMSGEETYRELRKINPQVRIVLTSGYSENDVISRFAGQGLTGCMQKPYTFANMRKLLSGLIPAKST